MPPPDQLAAEENLDGRTEDQLARFHQRAVPQPGATVRTGPTLTDDARLDVPTTVVCTAFPSQQYQAAAAEGMPFLAGLADPHDVTWVDLPTSHWPMWSRPRELADILGDVARASTD